jgi:hypothetical protein
MATKKRAKVKQATAASKARRPAKAAQKKTARKTAARKPRQQGDVKRKVTASRVAKKTSRRLGRRATPKPVRPSAIQESHTGEVPRGETL